MSNPSQGQYWLTPQEARLLNLVQFENGVYWDKPFGHWYASDESYDNLYGPFRTHAQAVAWQMSYVEGL